VAAAVAIRQLALDDQRQINYLAFYF